MLIEILLLNSRPCSTYEIPNPSRGPLSVSVVLFFSSQEGKSEPKLDFVLPEGLFLSNIRAMGGVKKLRVQKRNI